MIEIFIYENKFDIIDNGKRINNINDILDKEIDDEIRRFIINFENQKIDGLSINEMYKYDNVELYNFARGTIFENIREVLIKFSSIESIVRLYGSNILINTNDEVYKYISENIFNLKCINVCNDLNKKENNRDYKTLFKKIMRVFNGFKYLFKFKFLYGNKTNEKNNIIAITNISAINYIYNKNNQIFYDSHFGKVLNYLSNENNIFKMQYCSNYSFLDKANKLGGNFFPFENFVILKKFIYKLKIKEDKVFNRLDLIKKMNFEFHDFNIFNLLDKFIFCKIQSNMDSYLLEQYAAERIIKYLCIGKIILIDEADRSRCFIYSGNKLGLETYAIQHGIITTASCSYFIPTSLKDYIPKKTFLWGNVFKNCLIENTKVYNDDNSIVVGQPRTDYLFDKLKYEEKIQSSDNIKILYATQPIKDLTYEATELLLKSLSISNEKYELIIKLHPNDNYLDMYENFIKKYKIDNVKITKDMDIYDAILWANLVISVHSTINLEATILRKTSVCLLLKKYWDQGNFVKDNISIGASSEEQIIKLLSNITNNENNNNNFIEENFYKVDGLVSERIVDSMN